MQGSPQSQKRTQTLPGGSGSSASSTAAARGGSGGSQQARAARALAGGSGGDDEPQMLGAPSSGGSGATGPHSHKSRRKARAAEKATAESGATSAPEDAAGEESQEESSDLSARLQAELRKAREERALNARIMKTMARQIEKLTQLATTAAQAAQEAAAAAGAGARLTAAVQPPRMQPPMLNEEEQEEAAALDASAGEEEADGALAEEAPRPEEPRRAQTVVQVRRAVDEPSRLEYAQAADVKTLEAWFSDVELLFDQLGMRSTGAQLHEARNKLDADLRRWWDDFSAQAQKAGRPTGTFEALKEALREHFLPARAGQQAETELINIRQREGESMDAYLLRADRMRLYAEGAIGAPAVMRIVLDRVRKGEWPQAHRAATRAVLAGQVTTFAALRALLQKEALFEPSKAHGAQRAQGGGAGSSAARNKVRAAAVGGHDGDAEDEEDETIRAAPVGKRAGAPASSPKADVCIRCRKPGHRAQECKEPDTRTCYGCNKPGHLKFNCPERKKRVAAAALQGGAESGGAPSGGAQPKNE
jgi:hypothetical protein